MPYHRLLPAVRDRVAPPVAIVLGSPRPVADLIRALALPEPVVCYQQDLYQSNRLREELEAVGVEGRVETLPDLWDLAETFQTVIFPVVPHMERELKVDMIDQAFHVLRQGGLFVSLVEKTRDMLCPKWHKKVFGQCSESPITREGGTFWSVRKGDQERRRHEQTFHAKIGDGPSLNFVSRPGVFSYGRLDEGARALLEISELRPGDRILDLGCGAGANGVLAAFKAGEGAHVTFVDSNVRATALAEINARANGLKDYRVIATPNASGMADGEFDVVLANPPYYAEMSIARRFVEGAKPLLKKGGRFCLVTKQADDMMEFLHESFAELAVAARRGYAVFEAIA